MPSAVSRRLVTFAHHGSAAAAIFSLAVGLLVLAGWALDLQVLKSILPGAATMKVNTAVAFVLAGVGLGLLHPAAPGGRWQAFGRLCAALVGVIGFLTLLEYALGRPLGIDELLARDAAADAGPFPGRPAVVTAFNFLLVGLALWLLGGGRRPRLGQFLAVIIGLAALLALVGYLYGAQGFYQLSGSYAIALHTAIAFLVLALGLLLARPAHGWAAIVVSNGAGGLLARRLLPAAVLVPVVLGELRLLGQDLGLYDTRFGLALFATSNVVVMTGLIAASARALFRLDAARHAAEAQIVALNTELEQRVLERTAQLTRANAQLAQEAVERREIEAALRVSSERYRFFFQSHLFGVLVTAPDGRIIEANPEAARILERPAEEICRLGRAGVVDVSDPRLPAALEERARTGQFKGELTMLRPGGVKFPAEVFTALFRDQTGAEFSNLMIIDRTEQRQAEQALRDSEAKLRALFAALPVGISVLDPERRVIENNPALERILQLTPAGLAAGAYAARTYLHSDGTPVKLEELPSRRAIETQQAILDMEIGVAVESGETVWTSVSAAPVPGSSLGAVVVTTDITERKRTEAALAHERDLLQALLDNLPDPIYFKDTGARFTRINQAQARVLGLSDPQAAYGRTAAAFQAPPQAAELDGDEAQLLQTGRPIIDRQEYHPTPDGQDRWFTTTKVPLTDRHGRVQGLIGIAHDITQRIQAAEGLRQANAALTERVRQMALLHELDEQLQACAAMPEVYQVTAQLAAQLFPAVGGALYIATPGGLWLEAASTWGAAPSATPIFGLEDCWAIRRGQTYVAGPQHPTHAACRHLSDSPPALSLCIPILAQTETLGLLQLSSPPGAAAPAFDDSLLQLTRVVADSVALALANLSLREKLRQQAIRDPLTNLYNRRYMEESLERELLAAARRSRPVGVLMLDIDHFKQVNDVHGHSAGDALLREWGVYLRDHSRGGDIACRYGGEEFTLILPEADLDQTCQRAEAHRQAFQALALAHGVGLSSALTVSCGVAVFPAHGQTADALLRAADAALYEAKRAGRNCVAVAR